MAERVLPGIGLKGFDDYESPNWNVWADVNWRTLSALVQGRVLSAVTPLPGSPTNGDIYIIPVGETNAGKIAVRDDGTWINITAAAGWRMFAIDDSQHYEFDGTTWSPDFSLFPAASVTPGSNGEMTFELTSNTSLTVKVKGSDGVVRSAVLTLA